MLDEIVAEASRSVSQFWFIRSLQEVDRTDNTVKLRLHIGSELFVQVYASQLSGQISFALISHGQRLFGRNCHGGFWHRHPFDAPGSHDFSSEGSRAVSLTEFLIEVEDLLMQHNLL